MGKFVALAMGILLEHNWRNRAVENQIAAVQKNLLHCLPSFDWTTGQRWLRRVLLSLNGRILEWALVNTRGWFGTFQHWASVIQIVTLVVIALVIALVIASTIMGMRLVWVVVVCIVVLLGIHGVVSARRVSAVPIVSAMEVINRLLAVLVVLEFKCVRVVPTYSSVDVQLVAG